MKTLNIEMAERELHIIEAMDLALEKGAEEIGVERDGLVIVSWYDCKADRHSPGLISSREDYGKSHGANLRVVINDGEFVFLCEDSRNH